MKYALRRDAVWLESLHTADHAVTLLLLGGDGHQVAVPASLLLAASPLVRNILTDHLPPAYSQCFLSLSSATGVAAGAHKDRIDEVRQVFDMLGVNATIVSCHSESINVGQVLGEEQFTEEKVLDTVSMDYFENVPSLSQKREMSFAFNFKIEADVSHLVSDCESTLQKEVHKCSDCKYASYDKAELKTHHQLTSHGKRKIKFICQTCSYTCSFKMAMDYHCANNSGHVANKDEVVLCRKCDYIAQDKKDLYSHKKKVHIPASKLFECGDCYWVGEELQSIRYHAHSEGHKTKNDYEAAALAKAESKGPKVVANYRKSLAKVIKLATKHH